MAPKRGCSPCQYYISFLCKTCHCASSITRCISEMLLLATLWGHCVLPQLQLQIFRGLFSHIILMHHFSMQPLRLRNASRGYTLGTSCRFIVSSEIFAKSHFVHCWLLESQLGVPSSVFFSCLNLRFVQCFLHFRRWRSYSFFAVSRSIFYQ